jgi:hypothetical protein
VLIGRKLLCENSRGHRCRLVVWKLTLLQLFDKRFAWRFFACYPATNLILGLTGRYQADFCCTHIAVEWESLLCLATHFWRFGWDEKLHDKCSHREARLQRFQIVAEMALVHYAPDD